MCNEDQSNYISKQNQRVIAIIGMAARFPGADDYVQLYHQFISGKCNARSFPENRLCDINQEGASIRKGGYFDHIDEFDAHFFGISPMEAKFLSPAHRILLETSYEAIEDAGYAGEAISDSQTGVFIGIDHMTEMEYIPKQDIQDMLGVTGTWSALLANRISYTFNLTGPSLVLDTSCSSGLAAVHLACQSLKNDECSMAIAGGLGIEYNPAKNNCLASLASGKGKMRVFDNYADGMVWGEGVGVIVLKPYEKALEDKDTIHAVICGSAVNNNGNSNGILSPNPKAIHDAMCAAWNRTGYSPENLYYIEANGSATQLGDAIEIKAITNAFRRYTQKRQFCGIGTAKCNLGHSSAAASFASIIKIVMSFQTGIIAKTINFEEPNSQINFCDSPLYFTDRNIEWPNDNRTRLAAINAYGFGGSNVHVVLQGVARINERHAQIDKQILTISAMSVRSLIVLVDRYIRVLNAETVNLPDFCYTANTGRAHHELRLAIVFTVQEELCGKLQKFLTCISSIPDLSIFYSGNKGIDEDEDYSLMKLKPIFEMLSNDFEDLCRYYVSGNPIDWLRIYVKQCFHRIHLPTYPFEKKRFWIHDRNGIESVSHESPDLGSEETIPYESHHVSELESIIKQVFAQVLGLSTSEICGSFLDHGGNSILAIHAEYEFEKHQIQIPASILCSLNTLKDIVKHIQSNKTIQEPNSDLLFSPVIKTTLQDKRIFIDQITSFNNVLYKYCFYNALFPVVMKYRQTLAFEVSNDIVYFGYDHTNTFTDSCLCILSERSQKELLESNGFLVSAKQHVSSEIKAYELLECDRVMFRNIKHDIGYTCKSELFCPDKLLQDISKALADNRPIILWVDIYFIPFRKDTYQIEHWPHTILVTGMDCDQKELYIFEQSNKNSMNYKQRAISYDVFIESYKGFLDYFNAFVDIPTYYEIEAKPQDMPEIIMKNARKQYLRHFLGNSERIQNGIESLQAFIDNSIEGFLQNITGADETFCMSAEQTAETINHIVNGKKMERFQLQYLFGDQYSQQISRLNPIDEWIQIQTVITRYLYAKDESKYTLLPAAEMMDGMLERERSFYDDLISFLRRYDKLESGEDI